MKKPAFPSKDPLLKLKKDMLELGYNKKTITSYLYYITELLNFTHKTPRNINAYDVIRFINKLKDGERSNSTINTAISAFKFYFEKRLNRNFFSPNGKIKRVKHHIKNRTTITDREFKKIIKQTNSEKYKIIFSLLYFTGIKVSEIPKIKVNNIDFTNKTIKIVNNTKKKAIKENYNKTRAVKIPKIIDNNLREYTKNHNDTSFVFLNNNNNRVSERSIQKMFNILKNRANIKKQITCNSLRNSLVVNLIKKDTDLTEIQKITGYKLQETVKKQEKMVKNSKKTVKKSIKNIFHIR